MKRIGGTVSPLLVLALTALWLLLNQTLAPGHILLGALLAIALAWSASALRPLRAHFQRLDRRSTLGSGRAHGHRALESQRRAHRSRLGVTP